MPNPNGLNTSSLLIWKPKRVRDTKQLERLMTTLEYAKSHNLSVPAVKYQIRHGKLWATKIGNRVWIDPKPETP